MRCQLPCVCVYIKTTLQQCQSWSVLAFSVLNLNHVSNSFPLNNLYIKTKSTTEDLVSCSDEVPTYKVGVTELKGSGPVSTIQHNFPSFTWSLL